MMANVYVIKVKTKPPLSSLYPSERRYSASTVGGLSFVHFGLGALSLLLGSLALSLQGPILSIACLVPFATGLLAWKRWYIDRNIAIFFYGSLFSLVAAILCFVATVFDVAAANGGSLISLEKILEHPLVEKRLKNDSMANETPSSSGETFIEGPTPGIVLDNMSNISGYILRASANHPDEENFQDSSKTLSNEGSKEVTEEESSNATEESLKSGMVLRRVDYHDASYAKILLTVNVLVASLLEILWSILSARIALRGMMNRLPETSYAHGATGNTNLEGAVGAKRKPPAPRPDILDHDRRLSESLQNLNALHHLRNSGPRLPLPESSREFRERVERFLANQAAHRVVEGSCS